VESFKTSFVKGTLQKIKKCFEVLQYDNPNKFVRFLKGDDDCDLLSFAELLQARFTLSKFESEEILKFLSKEEIKDIDELARILLKSVGK